MIRFRQSMAKVLLTESPAHLWHQLARGRTATRAMQAGSLFDYLVFDLDRKYEVVDARYRSGARAGQPAEDWQGKDAQEARVEIEARGLLPVLQCEVDAMALKVHRARHKIQELLGDGRMVFQKHIEWTSGLGLPCEGTPDIVYLWPYRREYATADLKNVASVNPRKMQRQVYEMCWDVQAAAYEEAAQQLTQDEFCANNPDDPDDFSDDDFSEPWTYRGHTIIACESGGMEMIRAYPLDPAYQYVGKRRWEKAQGMFKECLASETWPSYPESPIGPPRYAVAEYEDEGDDLSDLGLELRDSGKPIHLR